MSLLTICQAVAEEVGIDSPDSIIGNSDRTAKQLLRLVNRTGKVLAKKPWTILQSEHTFTTVASTASYSLPSDFAWLLMGTAWDRDNYWQMRGGLSPAEWQMYKSGIIANTAVRKRFRIKASSNANKFFIDPTPSAAEDLVFEYVKNTWCTSSDGNTFRTAMAADTDVALISEELIELGAIWRFKNAKGLAYEEEYNEYKDQVDMAFARDPGLKAINMGKGSNKEPWRMNVPESGFGS